ncbi:MAG: ribbon-helix-helix domain-containing protein [Actinomycetota bacterium]|nr:ribbon-helix-helix domain-containing protein [Actinomycetota bacterium]
MKRTTVSLPDELARAVERESYRRRTSVSDVVREALVAHLGLRTDGRRAVPFAALGGSGHRTTARDFEEILESEWARARRP